MIEATFREEHFTVTLRVEGKGGREPSVGEPYKVLYIDKSGCLAETEWIDNFKPDEIETELELMAEDWLKVELERERRQFDDAS